MLQIGCILALLPVMLSARGKAVEPGLVGTWQLVVLNPDQGPRWLWDIHADGTYSFHAEDKTSILLHNGTISAKKKKYSLHSTTIDWSDDGSYDINSAAFLRLDGKLGTAWWKKVPAEGAPLAAGPAKAPAEALPAEVKPSAPSLPYQAAMNYGFATRGFLLVLFHGTGEHTDHVISLVRDTILSDPAVADQLVFADANVAYKESAEGAKKFRIDKWPALFVMTTREGKDSPRFFIFGERYGDMDAKLLHEVVLSGLCGSYNFPNARRELPPKGEALKAVCATASTTQPDATKPVLDPPALPPPPPLPAKPTLPGKQ